MAEILTESFCERCGTRYTFESAAPRTARLKGIKVLSRGLKNFVLSDDTSMDEAMAAARSETDRETTSHQLDAFHKTFNFCMTCRQYTCGNCWNEADGRCLTCAPHLGHDILEAPFPNLDPAIAALDRAPASQLDAIGVAAQMTDIDPLAWPVGDARSDDTDEALAADEPPAVAAEAPIEEIEPIDLAARLASLSGSESDQEAKDAAPGADVRADLDPTPGGRAATASAQTSRLFRRFRPGQNLDAAIDAFERDQAQADLATARDEPAPEPQPVAVEAERVVAVEPEPFAAVEPEPVIAVESEPVAAVELEPIAAVESEPVAAEPEPERDDVVAQPTWQIVAPDASPDTHEAPPAGPPVETPAAPQWPSQPEWPAQRPSAVGLPFLNRPAPPTGGLESLWAESAREVATHQAAAAARPTTGVQPCVSCGLSLSATARFCRRCGTPQA